MPKALSKIYKQAYFYYFCEQILLAMKVITSPQNKLIKYIRHLQEKSSLRRKEQKFVVEGRREVRLALEGGYELETVLFQPLLFPYEQASSLLQTHGSTAQLIEISPEVYERLAYRGSTEGIIAVGLWKDLSLEKLILPDNPLLLIAENIEKPGNIGAMLRTADAAALDAFVIANPVTDIYNPNIIRSSVGGIFTVQIAVGSTQETIDFLQDKNIDLFAATLQESVPYYEQDYTGPAAIAVGSEAWGLSSAIRQVAKANILIPMQGKLDSLNVSVSAAVLVFEAKRQRILQQMA